ncbi:MAG: DUF86 domain-containing protein [Acholeplasmatales bacterium]
MLSVKDCGSLLGITKRCKRIIEKTTNISKEDFKRDDDVKEIVCFNIFQIGELANVLSLDLTEKYDKISWKQIKGMRNRIVHGYDKINFNIVWETAIDSIPKLRKYCLEILENC